MARIGAALNSQNTYKGTLCCFDFLRKFCNTIESIVILFCRVTIVLVIADIRGADNQGISGGYHDFLAFTFRKFSRFCQKFPFLLSQKILTYARGRELRTFKFLDTLKAMVHSYHEYCQCDRLC